MDNYTATELAYQNGYAKGKAEKQHESEWVYADNSEIVCKACGTRQARFYGTGEAVPKDEQKFCHYCGSKMTYNLRKG